MGAFDLQVLGSWVPDKIAPAFHRDALMAVVPRVREPIHVIRDGAEGAVGVGLGGHSLPAGQQAPGQAYPLMASLPALYPEWLGDRSFGEVHGVRFPYVAGAMANGIATTELVIAMARERMLAFFGAAGLTPERVAEAVDEIQAELPEGAAWGSNLIHSPNEPDVEEALVDLYLAKGVRRVSASAFLGLTPSVVRYAARGLRQLPDGTIHRENMVFAKISRPEVARRFLTPAPPEMLAALRSAGSISAEEARLAAHLPIAEDITVEADSGGHTDNQTLTALFPTILALRDGLAAHHGYHRPIRVGAAGGLGTPAAVAAAFSLGAAFVLTGTVNQAAVESGLSENGKKLLAEAELADVLMAPAADMFELGVKVQVLKRGTMFGVRAAQLYEAYVDHGSMEELPAELRGRLERDIFRSKLEDVWAETKGFFEVRDPREVERANNDPKHKMALVFRWYLGKSSRWAIDGVADRRADYQIWCGPAMGAFNAWTAGSRLAEPENRTVTQIALNLLEGAAVATRAQQLRSYGVAVPAEAFRFQPRLLA